MGGQRALLEDDPLQAPLVIFQQFGRAQIAGDQNGILAQAHGGRRAQLARDHAQQPVRQIFQIVHPVGQ